MFFETRSCLVLLVSLELTLELKLALNLWWSSCLSLPSTWIRDMNHLIHMKYFFGKCAKLVFNIGYRVKRGNLKTLDLGFIIVDIFKNHISI